MTFVEDLQPYMTCKLVVLQCMCRQHWMLLYDGRHFKNMSSNLPLVISLLDKNGMLFDKKADISICPKLDSNNYKCVLKEEPLWQLLGLKQPEPNPVNYEETMVFLKNHKKEFSVNLYVHRQIQEVEDLLKKRKFCRSFSERLRQANGTAEIRLLIQEMNETIREFLNELSLINNDIRQVEYSNI